MPHTLDPNQSSRGQTLVITLVIVAVLIMIAASAMTRSTLELEGVGVRRKYDIRVGCVEAARQLVLSQLSLSGVQPAAFSISRTIGDLTIQTGHYDSTPDAGYVVADNNAGNCGTAGTESSGSGGLPSGAAYGNSSASNFGGSWGGSSNSAGTNATCGIRVPVVCRDAGGRQLEIEFLVRIGI